MSISLIVAVDDKWGIGNAGTLPWPRLPDDLRQFRQTTLNHSIVMGRATYESLGKPLPGRDNLVVTTKPIDTEGVEVIDDLDCFLPWAAAESATYWVIGGAQLYAATIPYASEMRITRVSGVYPADTYFPNLEWWQWQQSEESSLCLHDSAHDVSMTFERWSRIAPHGGVLYDFSAARTADQLEEMQRLQVNQECHFCTLSARREAIITGEYWSVFPNDWPYANTSMHVLIVPHAHHVSTRTLQTKARAEYLDLVSKVADRYRLTGYSQFMRAGEMSLTGSSVAHLHGHVIAPDMEAAEFSPIKVKLGTRPS